MKWLHVFIFVVVVASVVSNDQEIFEFYPCINTTKVIEKLNFTEVPPSYNLTVALSEFSDTGKRLNIKIKFDDYIMITVRGKWSYFISESYSFSGVFILENENEKISLNVMPTQIGRKLPNLISVQVNKQEVCADGVYKDIWDAYVTYPKFTTLPTTTISKNEVSCGRKMAPRGLVHRGFTAAPGAWPWHAALYHTRSAGAPPRYRCGGSLLSTKKVLTAGHCVIEQGGKILPERILVTLGKHHYGDGDSSVQERRVYEVHLHPSYAMLMNDIALVILNSEVTYDEFVQPVCLWSRNEAEAIKLVNKNGYVVGWGSTDSDPFSYQLQEAIMPVVPAGDCIKSHPTFYAKFLTSNTFCGGFGNGTSVCNGDSGGGMFFPEEEYGGEKVWFIAGIVSLGKTLMDQNVCDPTSYVIFTDVRKHLDFIESY